MIAGEENNKTVSQDQVKQFLVHAAEEHDDRVMAGERNSNLFPKPVYEEPPTHQRTKISQSVVHHVANNRSELKLKKVDDGWNFAALCRGEELRDKLPHVLTCHIDTRGHSHAWLRLSPPKVEIKHKEPDILVYHEIISKRELEDIKRTAAPMVSSNINFRIFIKIFKNIPIFQLARSQVQGSRTGSSEISTTRTSKTGWLKAEWVTEFFRTAELIQLKIHENSPKRY